MKTIIYTKDAPEPVGPYSQAVEVGNFVYCSGQVAIDPKTNQVISGNDIREHTQRVMMNIDRVLKAAGLGFEHVFKSTIFLTNMNDFQTVNQIYGEYFKKDPPARSTVEVKGLPKGVPVEIEVIAHR
jgi:2-iminobutanoate/2-iminopropanoate deaminase